MDWDILSESRKELTWKLGLNDSVFDELMARYVDNGLAYHNLDHVADCLEKYKKFKHLADTHLAVQTAIWFHDAIYSTSSKDNELKSAELAKETLSKESSVSKGFSEHVYNMIIGAVYKNFPTDKDMILLRDIDLSILGAEEDIYNPYTKKIRSEFWSLSDDSFAKGRKDFLGRVISKEIFLNKEIKEVYEDKARNNISREIMRLETYLSTVRR